RPATTAAAPAASPPPAPGSPAAGCAGDRRQAYPRISAPAASSAWYASAASGGTARSAPSSPAAPAPASHASPTGRTDRLSSAAIAAGAATSSPFTTLTAGHHHHGRARPNTSRSCSPAHPRAASDPGTPAVKRPLRVMVTTAPAGVRVGRVMPATVPTTVGLMRDAIVSRFTAGRLGPGRRREDLRRLRTETFDVLIIGGGVTGAGAALDAAARGLSVALVEARDLAAGTSSRSTKLIHGGL